MHRFHEAALAAGSGGTTELPASGPTTPGYYAAYVLDPDGDNVEAVFHGPAERSAPRRRHQGDQLAHGYDFAAMTSA